MAGGVEHPQFIFPSIQLLASLAQSGCVLVVVLLSPKAEAVTPGVQLAVEGSERSSLGSRLPMVRLACLLTQVNI